VAEYDRTRAPIGYVHATVALSGEAKLVAAELERMRVGGLVDRVTLEVIVPRARLDPTPEAKRMAIMKESDIDRALDDLKAVSHRLTDDQSAYVADVIRRFAAIVET
jgi:hypothetical protein